MKNPNLYTIELLKLSMMTRLMFLLLPLFFLATSCDDDDTILPTPETDVPGLPPATQTGAGTFGCLIDGEPWVAKSAPFASGSTVGLRVTHYPDWNGYNFQTYNNDDRWSIDIQINYVTEPDDYPIVRASRDYLNGGSCAVNEMNEDSLYYLNVTHLDLTGRIISGTFSFTTENEDESCSRIDITNGRFDATF